ncbi:hypothetical protein N7517_008739 [Penicillium concentricum]|uniref:Uncharacterized protein n=1 Tax=Penicillium concentricum TaxID=293559 RepID=A0A9W9RSY3_9EURO|nr:uncharacterized protein N7517_008739 [Penicillium concentricum]KAJ5365853.1 hypothetical protein N7517_008739 [Penicillium concentricum]
MDTNQDRRELPVSRHSNEARNAETNTPVQSPAQSPRILPVEPHPEPANEPLVPTDHKSKEKPTIWKLISDLFIWEILAMVLSSALLVAIVVILTQYDDRPQPSWTLSLNSVISWLSTVSKGCVLFSISEGIGQLKWVWFTRKSRPLVDLSIFDGASRGLWGCAALVWRQRAKHFAALGSLAVILAIAFDPFVQNLIHYYPKLIVDPAGTAIVSSNPVYDALGPPLNNAAYYLDPAMKANIYNSLFNSDPTKPWHIPQYTCSSGNCTWDPIATLEMRASCTNITDRLKTKCDNILEGQKLDSSSKICSVYLKDSSSNISAYVQESGTLWGAPVSIGSVEPLIYTDSIIPPIQLVAPDNLLPVEELWALESKIQPKWQAIECSIDPVVHSFRPTVRRGVYHEETLGIAKNGSFENLFMGSNYHMHPPWGPEMGVEKNKDFLIYKRTLTAIRYFFQDFFAGRAQLDPFGFHFLPKSVQYQYASADLIQLITLSNITGCLGGTAKQMHCAMDNVAEAMSKTIRDTPSSFNLSNTTGQAMTSMTHVSIHWQWIILPVLVWLLGLVTVLGTIWKTRKATIPTWKNDTIPLLSVYKNGQNEKLQSDEVSETERVTLYQSEGKMVLSG